MAKISLAEPVTELRRIPIVECGEELVDFARLCPELLLDRPRFRYRRETMLRRSVAEMLCEANRRLRAGYRLAVIEGWRPPHIQRRMYLAVWDRFAAKRPDWSESRLKRLVNRFTAPLDSRVPPPHTTGAAVDVMLADSSGKVLDHIAPYDRYDEHGFPYDAPGVGSTARETRDILGTALSGAGLTNYPSEFWHWSYGDQGWAYRGGHPHAIFGGVQPPNWEPDPGDIGDRPLEWIENQPENVT